MKLKFIIIILFFLSFLQILGWAQAGNYPTNITGITELQNIEDISLSKPTKEISVASDRSWQNSHLHIKKGDIIYIKASGSWHNGFANNYVGPDGLRSQSKSSRLGKYIGDEYLMVLLARIGDSYPFAVGSSLTYKSDKDGFLFFRGNSNRHKNNRGDLNVAIYQQSVDSVKKKTEYFTDSISREKRTANETEIELPSMSKFHLGKYYALVIGNNNYRYVTPLKSAKRDSKAIAEILESEYHFKVTLLHDATRSEILTALNEYRRNLDTSDNLLIYYAGHGWLDKEADEGYWLPVDAKSDNPVDWIPNSTITSTLKALPARHVLVVADSCFSGKLIRGLKIGIRNKKYYQHMSKKKSRTVMTSGGLEPVLDSGGKNNHSVFTSAFVEALKNSNYITDTTSLFINIRRQVMLNADQTPEYSDMRKAGHDGGDFLFFRRK